MNWDKLSPYFLKGARILNGTPSMLGTFKMAATVTDINTQQKKMRLKQDKAETVSSRSYKEALKFLIFFFNRRNNSSRFAKNRNRNRTMAYHS